MLSHLIGVDQLADTLKVPKKTIYFWVSKKEIPYLKVGRHLRFDLQQVIEFFRDQTRANQPACQVTQSIVNNRLSRSLKIGNTRISNFVHSERSE